MEQAEDQKTGERPHTVDSRPITGGARLDLLANGKGIFLVSDSMEQSVKGCIVSTTEELLTCKMQMDDARYANSPESGTILHCAVPDDSCTYRFEACYQSSTALPEKLWYIKSPTVVYREQSRKFVRVPAILPMIVRFKNAYGGSREPQKTTMVDISGNGICFISPEEASENSPVEIVIPELPSYGELRTMAIVCRCQEKKVLNHVVYQVGAMFTDHLSPANKMKLERALTQLQREYLKRGMGIR